MSSLPHIRALTFDVFGPNSFDVVGARACGMRGAYVNRYRLPYEDTPYQPDMTVSNFSELADALVGLVDLQEQ